MRVPTRRLPQTIQLVRHLMSSAVILWSISGTALFAVPVDVEQLELIKAQNLTERMLQARAAGRTAIASARQEKARKIFERIFRKQQVIRLPHGCPVELVPKAAGLENQINLRVICGYNKYAIELQLAARFGAMGDPKFPQSLEVLDLIQRNPTRLFSITIEPIAEGNSTVSLDSAFPCDADRNSNCARWTIHGRIIEAKLLPVADERLFEWGPDADAGQSALEGGAELEVRRQGDNGTIGGMGFTPVMFAAACGHSRKIAAFIKAKADLRATDYKGKTALHWASGMNCGAGQPKQADVLEVARLLLAAGADISVRNGDGETPLFAVLAYPQVVALFIDAKADLNARKDLDLHYVSNPSGQSPPPHETSGDTPLITAVVRYGHVSKQGTEETLQVLIKAGAKVNDRNDNGETALFVAVEQFQPSLVKILIQNGADVNTKNSDRISPLTIALGLVRQGGGERASDIVRMLREAGAKE